MNYPTVKLDQALRNGEPKSIAPITRRPCLIDAKEPFEDSLMMIPGYSDARIANNKATMGKRNPCFNPYFSARRSVAHSIIDQYHQNSLNHILITEQRNDLIVRNMFQRDIPRRRLRRSDPEDGGLRRREGCRGEVRC